MLRLRAGRRNQVWSWDLLYDQTEHGRTLRILTLMDEYTKQALAIHVGYSIWAVDAITVLEAAIERCAVITALLLSPLLRFKESGLILNPSDRTLWSYGSKWWDPQLEDRPEGHTMCVPEKAALVPALELAPAILSVRSRERSQLRIDM